MKPVRHHRTIASKFPTFHNRKGQDTNFVEKIWKSIGFNIEDEELYGQILATLNVGKEHLIENFYTGLNYGDFVPKHHTIRSGSKFKIGDKLSLSVWTDRPYFSPQLTIVYDLDITKVYDFEMVTEQDDRENDWTYMNFLGKTFTHYSEEYMDKKIKLLAQNDGFDNTADFMNWFQPYRTQKMKDNFENKVFKGQVICWGNSINY